MTSCPSLLSTVQFLHRSPKSRKFLSPERTRTFGYNKYALFFKKKKIIIIGFFLEGALRWVFVAVRGLSLAAVSRGYSPGMVHGASHCGGFSCCRAWAPGCMGSVFVACGLSCPVVCGIFLDQGSNPCPLHWQVESQPLDHQESSMLSSFKCLSHSLKERVTCG